MKLIYATHQRSIDVVGKSLIDIMDNSAYEASITNGFIRSFVIPFTVYQFVTILCFHEQYLYESLELYYVAYLHYESAACACTAWLS